MEEGGSQGRGGRLQSWGEAALSASTGLVRNSAAGGGRREGFHLFSTLVNVATAVTRTDREQGRGLFCSRWMLLLMEMNDFGDDEGKRVRRWDFLSELERKKHQIFLRKW